MASEHSQSYYCCFYTYMNMFRKKFRRFTACFILIRL